MWRTLGPLGIGVCLLSVPLGAQVGPLPGGANAPGPPTSRPQAPGAPARDSLSAPPAVGTGKIHGRVVAADTGAPLRRAQVRIVAGEVRVMKTASTDAEGRYAFDDLPAGRYSVSVMRNGYVTLQFGQQRPFEPGKPLELGNGQVADKIDFVLPRGGVIAGRITDELGEPLPGVQLRAMRYQYQPDGRRRLLPANTMGAPFQLQTDDLGQFRVFGLMPGSYVLSASMNQMMMMSAPGMVTSGSTDNEGYATTYFPGTASESEAQAITVNIGQESTVSMAMIPARLSRISGTIQSSQGRPAANTNFSLRSRDGMGSFGMGGGTSADGSFNLQNIPPGEYVFEVRPNMGRPGMTPDAARKDPEFASLPLSVHGQDLTGLIITTGFGGNASGRVVFEDGTLQTAAIGGQPIRVFFTGIEPNTPTMSVGMDTGIVGANGQFTINAIFGKGTFRVGGSSWAIKSVTLEGVDITDTPYEMRAGTNVTGLEITLSNKQTSVAGAVKTGGTPAKDYVVVMFPSSLRDGDIPTRFIRTTRPDQEGKFQMKGLPPADYFAVAVETIEQGEQWDPAFQDRMKMRAERFRLTEGQSITLDLQLVR